MGCCTLSRSLFHDQPAAVSMLSSNLTIVIQKGFEQLRRKLATFHQNIFSKRIEGNSLERQLLGCEILETSILYVQGSFEMEGYTKPEYKAQSVYLHMLNEQR